jgi:hypothetical protein
MIGQGALDGWIRQQFAGRKRRGNHRLVVAQLARMVDHAGQVRASKRELAAAVGVDPRSIVNIVHWLRDELGVLEVEAKAGAANLLRLVAPWFGRALELGARARETLDSPPPPPEAPTTERKRDRAPPGTGMNLDSLRAWRESINPHRYHQ